MYIQKFSILKQFPTISGNYFITYIIMNMKDALGSCHRVDQFLDLELGIKNIDEMDIFPVKWLEEARNNVNINIQICNDMIAKGMECDFEYWNRAYYVINETLKDLSLLRNNYY